MSGRVAFIILLLAPAPIGAASAACAVCHRAIYESYRRTPMAASSGATGRSSPLEQFVAATFTHKASGFQYKVSTNREGSFVEFQKGDGSLHGRKAMPYFIGSGAAARSYLIASDGFLYEAPVTYYSSARKWGLAPGYDGYTYPYVTRPVLPGCLNCHASFLEPVPGTQNRFATPPFREGGVACERCHGPGESHIAKMRAGETAGGSEIINPAKLPADRRDSICAQCHLMGEVRVMHPGADWKSYQPGARLSDSITVFVRSGTAAGMKVTSHVEKLAQSSCKRMSGDRLWCGTCHDAHTVPKTAERSSWFRGKCLGCHATGACRETTPARARQQDDCTACHMPKDTVTDAEHVVYTDHSIPRRARRGPAVAGTGAELVPFGGDAASERDLALAYAITATRQPSAASHSRAVKLLEAAERTWPDNVEVLLYLAEIYRNAQQDERAIPLYQRALRLDHSQLTGLVGLGAVFFQQGQDQDAIRLWQSALRQNSGLVLVGTNLAMAQWRAGNRQAAESTLQRMVELSPAFQPAVDLLRRFRIEAGHNRAPAAR